MQDLETRQRMQTSNSGPRPGAPRNLFSAMPGELQDLVLSEILCSFPTPVSAEVVNNGRYIGEHSSLSLIPWDVDLNIIDHHDPAVVARARRVMLVNNQFICIKSESVNLRPIFVAAQVPILDMRLPITAGRAPTSVVSDYFILTHQIERPGGAGSSITSTDRPWGRTRESLEKLGLTVHGRPQLQEFVIQGRHLPRFCEALNGADSGYHHFGECTHHRITIHGPFDDILGRKIPILEPENILKPYGSILRAFGKFDFKCNERLKVAKDIKVQVSKEMARPRAEEIIRDLDCQMSKGDKLLGLERPIQAAHTYARASQGLVWLFRRGMLPSEDRGSAPLVLAHLFFTLGLREAEAWLTEMERRTAGSAKSEHDTPVGGDSDCGDPDSYSNLRDLVRDIVIRPAPPPLGYDPSTHENALQLYHLAKADRLMNRGNKFTWKNINEALRLAPQDENIRQEAGIINSCMKPWLLRFTPEKL